MERIIITDRNETFTGGRLVHTEHVERDVTAAVVEWSLHQQVRDALAVTESGTPAQRIAALEAQVAALTRLVVGRDLLG